MSSSSLSRLELLRLKSQPRSGMRASPGVESTVEVSVLDRMPPMTVVTAASSAELEAAAEASLARETDVRHWSPVTTIPQLLLTLLADLNVQEASRPVP